MHYIESRRIKWGNLFMMVFRMMSIMIFLSALTALVSGGERRTEWKRMMETENEIGNSDIKIEYVGHLGKMDGQDENYMFHKPCDIEGDSGGNLYVLDGGNQRVLKFDNEGKFLKTFGRFGQGPGEFQLLLSIDIHEDGHVYIADWRNCRLEVFSSQGKYIHSIKLLTPVPRIRLLRSGEIAIMNPLVGRDNSHYEESKNSPLMENSCSQQAVLFPMKCTIEQQKCPTFIPGSPRE